MPYSSPSDLPDSVREHLPRDAQKIFVAAFNSAYEEYDEATAFKVAWSAVKKKFHKNAKGQWTKSR